jgi:formate dehydrogenase iron-sulfur subunit
MTIRRSRPRYGGCAHGPAGRTRPRCSSPGQPGTGGLHAFFLLAAEPEVYNLPPDPVAPARRAGTAWAAAATAGLAAAAAMLGAVLTRGRGR